uniref:Uncharacterized protein n=1 Tax=Glossina palpalis gambiensis TaxID=67801 RepID=A0A1B0ART6_9MUSC
METALFPFSIIVFLLSSQEYQILNIFLITYLYCVDIRAVCINEKVPLPSCARHE